MQTTFSKQELMHENFIQFLSKLKKLNCQGSECLKERDIDGFFKPGKTPWIGYPTEALVNLRDNKVEIVCYSRNSSARLQLIAYDEYDYGEEEVVPLKPNITSARGNIMEAKFIIEDARDSNGTSFYCFDQYSNKESPNLATVVATEHQYSEWSAWSSCEDVGKDKTKRRRTVDQDSTETQTRFCRCSDLSVPPSPR